VSFNDKQLTFHGAHVHDTTFRFEDVNKVNLGRGGRILLDAQAPTEKCAICHLQIGICDPEVKDKGVKALLFDRVPASAQPTGGA
jgi:hypothetical protein